MRLFRKRRKVGIPPAVNVSTMDHQCPTCGVPVDVVEVRLGQHVKLEPCSHEVYWGDL